MRNQSNNQNNKRKKLSGEWFARAREDELSVEVILRNSQHSLFFKSANG